MSMIWILAQPKTVETTDETIKIIFAAIFAAVWIGSGILSAMKKKTRQQTTGSWDRVMRDLGRPPATTPPPVKVSRRQMPQTARHKAEGRPDAKVKRNWRKAFLQEAVVPPIPVEEVTESPEILTKTDITVSEIGSAPEKARQAEHPIKMFLTARNLRAQYILTEVLQPPLSLREP